jgi:hypothetical protein
MSSTTATPAAEVQQQPWHKISGAALCLATLQKNKSRVAVVQRHVELSHVQDS